MRERLVACLGALLGIAFTGAASAALIGVHPYLPLIVAPMGASAVLVFAVPTSPLAQPWPVIGGNTISALVGVATARLVGEPTLAAALAVSLAIAAMSFTRSLHPPGGAAALTAVIGGPTVAASGFLFPFAPVALNGAVLVALGIVFHKLARRGYPHAPAATPAATPDVRDSSAPSRISFSQSDVDAALSKLGETYDIDRIDLNRLLQEVALQATVRLSGPIRCSDIMSTDVISVNFNLQAEKARVLLLQHNLRLLPVIDDSGQLVGTVGLRDLTLATGPIESCVAPAVEASPDASALALLPILTDGRTRAVVIVNDGQKIVGLVTPADLLAAMAGLPSSEHRTPRESASG